MMAYLYFTVAHTGYKCHFRTFILAVDQAGFYTYFAILKAIGCESNLYNSVHSTIPYSTIMYDMLEWQIFS